MPLPTPAQVALALAITKSKPITISFSEYFAQLREIIVDEPRKTAIEDQQYIDGVLFWKRAYEKCDTERIKLENRVFELEQQLQKTSTSSPEAEIVAVTNKKRKHSGSQPKQSAKANTQSKRRAVETKEHLDPVEVDFAFNGRETPSSCQSLLRCLFNLHRLRGNGKVSGESNGRAIKILCHAAAQFIRDQCQTPCYVFVDEEPFRSGDILKLTDHSWRTALLALGDTTQSIGSYDNLSCVSHMVLLFQTILGQLHQSSLDEACHRSQTSTKSNGRARYVSVSAKSKLQDSSKYTAIRKTMAVALCNMLECLDETAEVHSRIFEGFVCALLDHIGSALSLMVFADTKSDNPPEPGLLAPRGLVDVSHIETNVAVMTTVIAAPYLIYVLRKAIQVCRTFSESSTLSTIHPNSTIPTTNPRSSSIKTRFQETLLRGVFGNSEQDFNNAFKRSSEVTLADIDVSDEAKSPAQNSPDWFIRQIWEHIGWDVLVEKLEASAEKEI